MTREIERILPALGDPVREWEAIEKRILKAFLDVVYRPLVKMLGQRKRGTRSLLNAIGKSDPLWEALRTGEVYFHRGVFSGRFNSGVSSRLRSLGARFNRRDGTYRLPLVDMPIEVKNMIIGTERHFVERTRKIDAYLATVEPDQITGRIKIADLFDRSVWRVEKEFRKNVKNITVAPVVTADQRKEISEKWQANMDLWVKDFTGENIKKLREMVYESTMAGNRYGALSDAIRENFNVTRNKAKFLARQETHLLMAAYKETRYKEVGLTHYKWQCVAGTLAHPVRPAHKDLDGKTFSWDDPPVTTGPGEPVRRNNPGQDYNCRCSARPIVFRETGNP